MSTFSCLGICRPTQNAKAESLGIQRKLLLICRTRVEIAERHAEDAERRAEHAERCIQEMEAKYSGFLGPRCGVKKVIA